MIRSEAARILQHIDAFKAFGAGETIQVKQPDGTWITVKEPNWRGLEYRVRPKEVACLIRLFVVTRFNDGAVFYRKSAKAARRLVEDQRRRGFNVRLITITKDVQP